VSAQFSPAIPKSTTIARSLASSTFEGLRSRWITPAACAAASPPATSRSTRKVSGRTGSRPSRADIASPAMYSIVMKQPPESSTRSWSRHTLGWVTLRAMRTSLRKNAILAGSCATA
jgi:hypothetical protein